jgi:hypothetical protein
MNSSPPIFLLTILFTGAFGAAAIFYGRHRGATLLSRPIMMLALLPSLAALGLFYTLAVHMHSSLGGWPESIGREGFPVGLSAHADIASWLFGSLFIACIFLWLVAAIVTLLIKRCRPATPYLGIFAVSCSICFAAMMLAPSEFYYWWWD